MPRIVEVRVSAALTLILFTGWTYLDFASCSRWLVVFFTLQALVLEGVAVAVYAFEEAWMML